MHVQNIAAGTEHHNDITVTSMRDGKTCEVQAISYSEFKGWMANSVDLGEVAYYRPLHQDQCCLQIQLFPVLVRKEYKFNLILLTVDFGIMNSSHPEL